MHVPEDVYKHLKKCSKKYNQPISEYLRLYWIENVKLYERIQSEYEKHDKEIDYLKQYHNSLEKDADD